MFILKHKKIFIGISAAMVLVSLVSLLVFGIKVGIDFKGGALSEVTYEGERPAQSELYGSLSELGLGAVLLQPTGDKGYLVKTRDLSDAEHTLLLGALSKEGAYPLTEQGFSSIGPAVGRELTRKALFSVMLVSLTIIGFIAFAFRKVSRLHTTAAKHGVPSWKYGIIAIITLMHDVIIPSGIFVYLSRYRGAELDTLFVVAALTILGLSLSDTIVIFDRIRENIKNEENNHKREFSDIVGKSLEQTYMRSLVTSFTVVLVLVALFVFGPVSTRYFAFMLGAGMFFGMYSSIFLASPLLVLVAERQAKKAS